MSRFLFGFLLALALVIPATLIAAPPHTVNVTNPMSGDLNANSWDITNVSSLNAALVQAVAGLQLGTNVAPFPVAGAIGMADGTTGTGVSVIAGQDDPTCKNFPAGSLYLRHAPDGHGELWAHTATDPCSGWVKIA